MLARTFMMTPVPAKVANAVKFQDSGGRKSDKPRAQEFAERGTERAVIAEGNRYGSRSATATRATSAPASTSGTVWPGAKWSTVA